MLGGDIFKKCRNGGSMIRPWDSTFSIVCRCADSGDLAVAVCTARPAVGNRVPFVLAGGAAVATQADTNPALGYRALQGIKKGLSAEAAMIAPLALDSGRARRQFSIITASGDSAFFTGSEVIAQNQWAGAIKDVNAVVAGNLLVGPQVLYAMLAAFEQSTGFLGERALCSLEAGQAVGGDKRGKISAALLVARDGEHPLLDLRIDKSDDPVADLRELYTDYLATYPL